MRRNQLLVTLVTAIAGAAAVDGSAGVSARENDRHIASPPIWAGTGNGAPPPELEVREDNLGNRILADPVTGEVIGTILGLSVKPEVKPYTLSRDQLKAAIAVKLSVTDVIAAIEQRSGDHTVLEVSFEPTRSAAAYALKTYRKGAIWEGRINADSGEMLGPGNTIPDTKLDADDKAELSGLESALITIVQAVQIAERHAQGKAIAVGLEESDESGAIWEVVVVVDEKAHRIFVHPTTGDVKSS